MQETLFHCGDDWEVRQVAQGCFGLFILGDIQKLPAPGPWKRALGDPIWARVLNKMTSRGAFLPQPFCNSEILWSSELFSYISIVDMSIKLTCFAIRLILKESTASFNESHILHRILWMEVNTVKEHASIYNYYCYCCRKCKSHWISSTQKKSAVEN